LPKLASAARTAGYHSENDGNNIINRKKEKLILYKTIKQFIAAVSQKRKNKISII